MKREIITTADGSTTIFLPEWNEHYHSKHGAIQEARHVFIDMGLDFLLKSRDIEELSILEIGFGTGLNAFITLLEAEKRSLDIRYTGVEAYPVSSEEIALLNYAQAFSHKDANSLFASLHRAEWGQKQKITSSFELLKEQQYFRDIRAIDSFDLVYFDAFGPRVQPDLWSEEIFQKMFAALKPEGVLVTYSAKGSVRRAMETIGFVVERLPGPPGKREMLRALKTSGHPVKK